MGHMPGNTCIHIYIPRIISVSYSNQLVSDSWIYYLSVVLGLDPLSFISYSQALEFKWSSLLLNSWVYSHVLSCSVTSPIFIFLVLGIEPSSSPMPSMMSTLLMNSSLALPLVVLLIFLLNRYKILDTRNAFHNSSDRNFFKCHIIREGLSFSYVTQPSCFSFLPSFSSPIPSYGDALFCMPWSWKPDWDVERMRKEQTDKLGSGGLCLFRLRSSTV